MQCALPCKQFNPVPYCCWTKNFRSEISPFYLRAIITQHLIGPLVVHDMPSPEALARPPDQPPTPHVLHVGYDGR